MRRYGLPIALAVAIVGAVLAVWMYVRPAPPPAEASAPAAALGEPIVEVTAIDLEGVERLGKAAYEAKCQSCHGVNAAGQEGVAPPFVHKIYEPSHHGDMAFHLAVQQGVRAHHWPFGNMPPIDGLSVVDVNNIIAYVRALQRANGIN